MMLAGLRVPDADVRELARLVDEPTRSVLRRPSDSDRCRGIDRPRPGERLLGRSTMHGRMLAELRAVLLKEHEGRVRDGLV